MVFKCESCSLELNLSVDWIHLGNETEVYKCRRCGWKNTRESPKNISTINNPMVIQMETAEWAENGRNVIRAKLRLQRLLENV